MSITTNTIAVTVDGVDKTSVLKKDSLFIRFQLNRRSNICELKFINYKPADRAEIQVSVNGEVLFGGYAVTQSAMLEGNANESNVTWSVECKDWSELFETVVVSGEYINQSDKDIITSLFSLYMPFDLGFAFDSTQTLKSQTTIKFDNVTLKTALDQLAKLVGANWFVKPNKDLYWFKPSLPDQISYKISSTPNNTTSFGFLKGSLSYSLDSSTIINQVKVVSGFKSTGTKQTDTFTGDGSTKTFTLTSYPDSILFCGYNDGLASYVTYGSFVGQSPTDKLISQGGNKTVVVDYVNKTITMEGNTGLAPEIDDTITVEYYYREKIDQTFDDQFSQEEFGTFPYVIQNKELDSSLDLDDIVSSLLENNSYAKPSIKFSTTKYGLLPGQLLEFEIPELDLASQEQINRALIEAKFGILLESDDYQLLQQDGVGRSFMIQEVAITPVVTPTGFMIVSDVTCGKWTGSLVDSLSTLGELQSASGKTSSPIPTQLSNISSNLGEVVIGRATFTDGGTAPFNWGTPNAASGVVVGLEDTSSVRGAMYIYDGGTVRAKLGYMTGLPMIGTVTPSGWGLYTENGYFTGVVAASKLIGGTVEGSLISGGTVTGNLITGGTITGSLVSGGTVSGNQIVGGTITGNLISGGTVTGSLVSAGTITGNQITGGTVNGSRITGGSIVGNTIVGGTIATSTPPINSSNPGVVMDSTGLYGYGTVGLVFRLSSDPSVKPWFSSGTILNTVYEVNDSAVIRTGTTNPRVQIDSSGIFAYDSFGSRRFYVDSATGLMEASNGYFSGLISASSIIGNSVSGGTITGALIQGNTINAGTITGNLISGGTITSASFFGNVIAGNSIHTNELYGNLIQAGTINGVLINGNTLSGNTISGGTITGGQIVGGTITSGVLNSGTINASVFNTSSFNTGTVNSGQIVGGTITGALVTGGTVSSASGNVYLDSVGLNLIATGSYSYGDQRNIKWRSSVGGSIVVEAASSWNGTYAEYWLQAGFPNFRYGIIHHAAYNNSGFGYSEIQQYPTQLTYMIDGNSKFQVDNSAVTTWVNLIPDSSANNRQLGDSTHGFRYLYLKDDSGNVRRVSINSSGVLTVT